MGKINKYANLYDKDGSLLRKAPLKDVTIEELEKMLEDYKGDKQSREYTNMIFALTDLYRKYGNPHEKELLESLKAVQEKNTKDNAIEALNALNNDIQNSNNDERTILGDNEEDSIQNPENKAVKSDDIPSYSTDTNEAEYVNYEEV
jgi:hypothetical protein